MNEWTAGYVADIGYTYGYYPELNPLRIRQAFLSAGLVFPEVNNACELGFGQGISVNLHAAASTIAWHGTDFNPAHAGYAQELAALSESGASLYDESFAEFAQRTDLPDFDFIGLHGIWSWISDQNRSVIVDFLRRKLKVGGVLYISYNAQPGWAAFSPMRHLMTEHAKLMGPAGHGIEKCVSDAIDFSERLLATNPAYARANPRVTERLQRMKTQSRQYLAHEYFNRDWQPMHFSEMAQWLSAAKLGYAVSACYTDHIDPLNLTPDQLALLAEIPEAGLRQTVRDFMVNQQFRRDYWVKGGRKLGSLRQAELQQSRRLVLLTHRPDVPLKISAAHGEVTLNEAIYGPILDHLADHAPKSIRQLSQTFKGKNIQPGQLLQALHVLEAAGHLVALQEDATIERVVKRTARLNAHLLDRARENGDVGYLASPVTGGGIPVGRFPQLFLRARAQGLKTPEDWAKAVWSDISGQGEKLMKEGKVLATAEENLTELTLLARNFAVNRLPGLLALQIG